MARAAVALLCLLLAVAMVAAPAAARTFRCDEVWHKPSSKNNLTECLGNLTHLEEVMTDSDHLPHLIFALLPVAFLAIGLVMCPTVCCGRCCCKCCGGRVRTPDAFCFTCWSELADATEVEKNIRYPRKSVRNTQVCAVVVMVFSFCFLIVTFVGGTLVNQSYSRVFAEAAGVISWVDLQAANIRTVLTINETGQLIPPLTDAFFTNIDAKTVDFRRQIVDTKSAADPFVEYALIAALAVGILPLIISLITVTAAVCDCRSCLPNVNLCLQFFFLIPYGVLGFVFLGSALVFGDVCGERDVYLEDPTAPGIFSLALVPICEDNVPFESTKNDVRAVITEQAVSACSTMTHICDASETYDSANAPARVYKCPHLTNATQQCPTFADAETVGNGLVLKDNPNVECRWVLNDASTSFRPCNISMCGEYCVQGVARNNSAEIVTTLSYASNGEYAFNSYVAPLLDCDVVYQQVLRPLVVCPELVGSMQALGACFTGSCFFFLVGMCVLWRGQKRFFKRNHDEEYALKTAQEEGDWAATSREMATSNEPLKG